MRSWITTVVTITLALALSSEAMAQCTRDTDCKGDRICHQGVCVSPGAVNAPATTPTPAPATPVHLSTSPTLTPQPPVAGGATLGGDPGWSLAAGIMGSVTAGIVLAVGIGCEVTDDNDVGIPLGSAGTLVLAVMGPVVHAGSGSARKRSGVPGVPALRVTGWIGYGLALLDASVAIGLAAADVVIPSGIPVTLGVLGMASMLAFSIDAFVARNQALSKARPAAPAAAGVRITPVVTPVRLPGGQTAGLFGVGGTF